LKAASEVEKKFPGQRGRTLAEADWETVHDLGPHSHSNYQLMKQHMLKGADYVRNDA
jgi:hypothetical protein